MGMLKEMYDMLLDIKRDMPRFGDKTPEIVKSLPEHVKTVVIISHASHSGSLYLAHNPEELVEVVEMTKDA